jgi:hypothetical protein
MVSLRQCRNQGCNQEGVGSVCGEGNLTDEGCFWVQ